ncbi:MAG TPA: putative baseplate assembly protein, partial [Gammaproteobacteria bacterium]|nr:putative baseplate assembly protein [Gammaproteobacteria bacterium]
NEQNISKIRTTKVYTQPEVLELAEEPINDPIGYCPDKDIVATDEAGTTVELDGFYEGLEAGRWVVISGERILPGADGVRFSELAMLSAVTQDVQMVTTDSASSTQKQPRPGERKHTFIRFAKKLSYCFKRDTVTIYGNVVKATHGETRNEVLGSGDGSKKLQSFQLKQFPLTHVPASNPSGVDSTLKIYVNDLQWHESDSLAGLQKTDRKFITKTDDEQKTTVTFGNGKQGALLPTGIENIRAEYRNGIGKQGNVRAEQITLLASKPLGVKEVVNPLRASGGADRENRDQARKSAPLAVMALDRLVSVRDYQDFARLYAGIGKASAVEISDGRRQLVHVTIAGADDIPVDESSDLFLNLRQALHDFGDPHQPIQLAVRELMFIVISTNVQIQPDYQWEPVVKNLRAALLDAFGFERRELGQDVLLSEVISVMQRTPGIAYVDVDTFGGIPEKQVDESESGKRRLLTPDEIAEHVQALIDTTREKNRPEPRLRVNQANSEHPAQLAFLTPDVPDTLILNQIK